MCKNLNPTQGGVMQLVQYTFMIQVDLVPILETSYPRPRSALGTHETKCHIAKNMAVPTVLTVFLGQNLGRSQPSQNMISKQSTSSYCFYENFKR